jgi:hypothetical protein
VVLAELAFELRASDCTGRLHSHLQTFAYDVRYNAPWLTSLSMLCANRDYRSNALSDALGRNASHSRG